MKILTFDTSLDRMYVTLSIDGNLTSSEIVENNKGKYHSAYLIPTIIKLLQENNLKTQDLNAIGVNTGPGSFTGIRASVTVARVMGQTLNIPLVGVSSLEIISLINNSTKPALCLMDAKKSMAYAAVYEQTKTILAPQVVTLEQALNIACENDYIVISDNKTEPLLNEQGIISINYQKDLHDFGVNLAKLTEKYLKSSEPSKFNWYSLKPLYIQPPPITMPKGAVIK